MSVKNTSRKQSCMKNFQVIFYVDALYVQKNRRMMHRIMSTSEGGKKGWGEQNFKRREKAKEAKHY